MNNSVTKQKWIRRNTDKQDPNGPNKDVEADILKGTCAKPPKRD